MTPMQRLLALIDTVGYGLQLSIDSLIDADYVFCCWFRLVTQTRVMPSRRYLLTLVVLLVPVLTGSQCVLVASSGDGNLCKPTPDRPCNSDNTSTQNVVVAVDNGQFIDAPVQGLRYESGSLSGTTGEQGEFQYEAGNSIRFFIGDLALGEAVKGKAIITPLDLVPKGSIDTPAVINIARLLQSLDSIPDDNRITLPARRNYPSDKN